MNELKRLKENINALIEGGYDDDFVSALIEYSFDLVELNEKIEYQMSYSDCEELEL